MNKAEANIEITRNGGKLTSVSVSMPIWNKASEYGNLHIDLPMLGIDTIAKDDKDAEKAIEEAIVSFCIASERFGKGVEKELQALGWTAIDKESGSPILGYCVSDADAVLDRLIKTGDNYANSHLEIEHA